MAGYSQGLKMLRGMRGPQEGPRLRAKLKTGLLQAQGQIGVAHAGLAWPSASLCLPTTSPHLWLSRKPGPATTTGCIPDLG